MGTQQLLLIVLGVIIVGIAIAVGITIFNNQAFNANQQAVSQELNTYASMVLQWYKTPASQGGKGQGNLASGDAAKISAWCGLGGAANSVLITDNGKFTITTAADGTAIVGLTGCGREKRSNVYPKVVTTITLNTSTITSQVSTDSNGDPTD